MRRSSMALSDAFYGGQAGQERPGFVIMNIYLDDLVRHLRDASVIPGLNELLELGAILAIYALFGLSQPIV